MAKSNKSGPVTIVTPAQATTPAAAPVATPAKPAHVALRGGAAVALVQVVAGATYRTKAPHNQAWWDAVTAAATAAPAPVATLCAPAPGLAVPTHFVGYCLRRGYLAAVQPA